MVVRSQISENWQVNNSGQTPTILERTKLFLIAVNKKVVREIYFPCRATNGFDVTEMFAK